MNANGISDKSTFVMPNFRNVPALRRYTGAAGIEDSEISATDPELCTSRGYSLACRTSVE